MLRYWGRNPLKIARDLQCELSSFPVERQQVIRNLSDRSELPAQVSSRTYEDAINKLNTLDKYSHSSQGSERDLSTLLKYMKRLGYTRGFDAVCYIKVIIVNFIPYHTKPESLDTLNAIHVAGTKGKGSVCAFTESILRRCQIYGVGARSSRTKSSRNVTTGLFTSPHLVNPTERIKINGKSISEDTFARLFFYVWDKLHEYPDRFEGLSVVPPYFRYIFLMAIQEFFEKKVDVAIIEVGLGGEKDPTNVLKKPVVCVITLIGYDHEHILGSTLAEIAWQKAGIFKRGSLALTIIQQPEAASSIEKRAADAGLKCYRVVKSEGVASDWTLGIKGDHQYQNAALAAEAARSWCEHFNESNLQRRVGITGDIVEEGLKYTHWQGRTEVLKSKLYPDITWYVDGAHNIDSIQACVRWFSKEMLIKTPKKPHVARCLIFNLSGNRTLLKVAPSILQLHKENPFDKVVFTTNSVYSPEDTSVQEQFASAWTEAVGTGETVIRVTSSIKDAVIESSKLSDYAYFEPKEAIVLVTGSLYLVGGVLEILEENIY